MRSKFMLSQSVFKGLALGLFCLTALVGCEKVTDGLKQAADEVADKVAESNGPSLETKKWNAYIDLTNKMDKTLNEAIERYIEAFGDDKAFKKPSRERNPNRFSSSIRGVAQFNEIIDRAAEVSAKTPQDDLDKAAAALTAPLKVLLADFSAMKDYLESKGYIDDNYAKANELHPRIIANIEAVMAAQSTFSEILASRKDAMREKDLKEMQAQGFKIRSSMLGILASADKIQAYLVDNEITSRNLGKLNMTTYRPLYDGLAEALKTLEAVAGDKDQAKKEGLDLSTSERFLNEAKKLKASAAGVIERQEQKKSTPYLPEMTEGTPEHFSRQFDSLIDSYNRIVN